MDTKSDMSLGERTFGHCIVSWEIKNYGLSLWKKDLEISTPKFSIKGPGSQVTKWKLRVHSEFDQKSLAEKLKVSIHSKPKEVNISSFSNKLDYRNSDLKTDEDDKEELVSSDFDKDDIVYSTYRIKNISLCLERLESDEGPSEIWVDWKVYSIGLNGEKFSLAHEERCFIKNQQYGFYIGTIYDLEKDFEYNSGVMTIFCDMVVKNFATDIYSDDIEAIDMQRLSKDLKWIFNQNLSCDAEIKVDGKSIMVHKAILCSRSSYFDYLFKSENSNVIKVPDIKYNEMLKILEYIYTYDLKDVIGQPSVCVYESAILMNLKDLAAYYIPEEYKIHTILDVKKLTFTWTLNFTAEEINCRSSPIFTKDFCKSAWQIHLYPKGTDCKSEYVSIAVECIEGDLVDELCVQCAVLKNEKQYFWKTLHKSERTNVFQEQNFLSREDVFKLLNKDSLRLGLKIRMCKGKESSIVQKSCTPVLHSMTTALDDMSKNMLSLRRSNRYTDVILKIGDEEINAHSYILAARSYLLSKMLKEGTNLVLSNVSPEIFNVVLDYIYSAVLNTSDIKTIIEVYKAAEEYVVSSLQDKCSRILQNNITVKEACSILRLATIYNDKYLKQTVLEFMSLKENKFTEHMLEETKHKANLIYETAKIPKYASHKKLSPESIVKEIFISKCSEKPFESYNFNALSTPSNVVAETTDKNVKGKFLDCLPKENIPSDEFVVCLIVPDSNGGKEMKAFTYEKGYKDMENKFDTIFNSFHRTEREVLGEDKELIAEGCKNKDINGIKCPYEAVASQFPPSNTNSEKNGQNQSTSELSSATQLNKEEMCVNENASADIDESGMVEILHVQHEKASE